MHRFAERGVVSAACPAKEKELRGKTLKKAEARERLSPGCHTSSKQAEVNSQLHFSNSGLAKEGREKFSLFGGGGEGKTCH